MFEALAEQEKREITDLLRKTGSKDQNEAMAAQEAFAAALTTPLRQGILVADNISNIFTREVFDPTARIEYPIDFFRPDNANEFVAFTIPNQGKIPQRHIEGDYVTVPTYDIGAGIDWLIRYAQEARWDIVGRAMEVFEAGFVKKKNDDGWHILLAAAFDRNLVVSDANAAAGQFTKRLVSTMKLVMRRNGGGNSSSMGRSRLTHLYVSPEAMEDMRNWGIDEVDELTRREIYLSDNIDIDGAQVFGVRVVPLDEFGEGQEYQEYYSDVIATGASNGGLASATDLELVLGLDLSVRDSFVMPVREELQIHPDPTLTRERRAGIFGWESLGMACLSNIRVLLGSL
jgi:hypothetical protein